MDRHGLPQEEQTRLRTASVDSEKLEWEVSSACSWASSTDFRRAPQSPHFRDTPAIDESYRDCLCCTYSVEIRSLALPEVFLSFLLYFFFFFFYNLFLFIFLTFSLLKRKCIHRWAARPKSMVQCRWVGPWLLSKYFMVSYHS